MVGVFSRSLDSSTDKEFFKTLRMPRPVPGKSGFGMLILPNWKTELKVSSEASLSLRDTSNVVDYLERERHLESWRGIWPDKEILAFFHSVHKVPMDEESIVFHPWNQHFVRLQRDFGDSGQCIVPGISAFQLPEAAFFYLMARVDCPFKARRALTRGSNGITVTLSENELVVIGNILRQLTLLNKTWVEIEGNYIEGMAVLLPRQAKYIFLSSKLYYQYNLAHPYEESSNPQELFKSLIKHSITMIKELPIKKRKSAHGS